LWTWFLDLVDDGTGGCGEFVGYVSLGVSLGNDGFRGIQRYIENDSTKEFPTRIMKTNRWCLK